MGSIQSREVPPFPCGNEKCPGSVLYKSEAYGKYLDIRNGRRKKMLNKKLELIKAASKSFEYIICKTKKEAKDLLKLADKNGFVILPPKPLDVNNGDMF